MDSGEVLPFTSNEMIEAAIRIRYGQAPGPNEAPSDELRAIALKFSAVVAQTMAKSVVPY